MFPCKTKVCKCPWGLEWQKPENRIIPNSSMVQWPLPALGSGLGLDSSLRPEGDPQQQWDPAAGCVHGPTSAVGFVTGDVTKHGLLFSPVSKTNKIGNLLTCGQLRKEKLLTREHWGRCPREEAPTAREDPSAASAPGWGRHGPWGHGSCSPPAACRSWLLAW